MRLKNWLPALLIFATAVLFFLSGTHRGNASAQVAWEHKILVLNAEYVPMTQAEQVLTQHGADGWELIQVNSDGTGRGVYYMKRRK